MLYAVGIRPATTVWAPGTAPLPPKPWSGRGILPTRLRREPGNEPVSVKTLAITLPPNAYATVTWREGSNADLSSRFAAVRVRPTHRDYLSTELRPEEWLLIEWPEDEAEPTKYLLSTGPSDATLEQLVFVTKMRWRIERDYQELKQEFGLSHYEGRGWLGFHHHATLCIAAYAFLVAQRLSQGRSKKLHSTRNAFVTLGLPPSRPPDVRSGMCLIRFQRCVSSSRKPSPANFCAVRAAAQTTTQYDTVRLGQVLQPMQGIASSQHFAGHATQAEKCPHVGKVLLVICR